MPKRLKTKYAGVYYREANRIGGKGTEKVYYVTFKKDGKTIEEKAGRQFVDDMTPARASGIRAELIEGKRLLRKEQKQLDEERKKQEEGKQTIDRLWKEYKKQRTLGKSLKIDTGRYEKYLKDPFGDKEPHEILPLETDRLRLRLLKKLSPQTVKHILNLLTWIINFGANKGLSQGLTFTIKKPTVDNKKTEDLSAEQLKRLLATIEKSLNSLN